MTISRSLNFSLFQSSSGNTTKEEAEEDEEDEDYDWGEYDQSDVSEICWQPAALHWNSLKRISAAICLLV